ncbi:MAG: MBL fold metallo-hydrolase [Geminicoccaceae bacterium]|nr:MBL fold metallo-hydrolase [Geminicoccaceae bacterium]
MTIEFHAAAETPAPGEIRPLRDGLFWLRLPLPFALDHVNVWLLDDGDGWTVIDAGVADRRCRAIWDETLQGFLKDRPVRRIIATHFHPDHAGLFGELAARTGAEPLMSRTEWLMARGLALDDTPSFLDAGAAYDRAAGLPPALVATRRARGNLYAKGVVLPPARISRVEAGDRLRLGGRDWTVRVGRGHAPEMLTFAADGGDLLIAADQILPRISPVVGIMAMTPEKDPLEDFLASLDSYLDLPGDTLVLPSHDAPFVGLHDRVRALKRHHGLRLARCLDAAFEPRTPYSMLPDLFQRRLDDKQLGFALAETLAHLVHLERKGEMTAERDKEGVVRYRRR